MSFTNRGRANEGKTTWISCALALAVCSCATNSAKFRDPKLTQAEVGVSTSGLASAESNPGKSSLRVTVDAPSQGTYNTKAFGASGNRVAIRVTNLGSGPANVSGFRARFAATREGVSFPCAETAKTVALVHEPTTIERGDSFVYERELDCSLSLPGRYDVQVYVDVNAGREGSCASESGRPGCGSHASPVAMFRFDLQPGPQAPEPIAERPGLSALMTADRMTRPLDAEAWARGDYRVVLALVNGGARATPLGPADLTFAVRKKGSRVHCSGESVRLDLPKELAPGQTYVAYAPLGCAPAQKGEYEVSGKLSFGPEAGGGQTRGEVEVGRLGLLVTDNPIEFVPISLRDLTFGAPTDGITVGPDRR